MDFVKKNGITMIALIITVIVMLIIAGVSIAWLRGDNNVIDKAVEVKLSEEQRSKKEVLEQALIKYNNGDYVGNYSDLREFLIAELKIDKNFEGKPNIAEFKDLDGEVAYVIHDFQGEAVYLKTEDEFWKIENFANLGYIAKLEDGDVLISPKSDEELDINGDKFAIINNADDLKDISFNIPANKTVSIKLLSDMTITNEGLKRSAINLNSGSVLNLQVESKVTVNSTLGEDANGAIPGKGGYAGIHVPTGATLNLSGSGVIVAIGGDAGDGSKSYGNPGIFTAGGGGAGAGIGGNGGDGAMGAGGKAQTTKICQDGKAGKPCGIVNISGNLTVYAYGGGRRCRWKWRCTRQRWSWRCWWLSSCGYWGRRRPDGAGSTCCAGAGRIYSWVCICY